MSIPLPVVDGLLQFGGKIIERLFPDPLARAQAQVELVKLQQTGELAALAAETDLAKGQLEVNKAEAASGNLFVAGWRPGAGWVCVIALLYQFLLRPALLAFGKPAPDLAMGDLLTILLGMLGLGGLRTKEKLARVAAK